MKLKVTKAPGTLAYLSIEPHPSEPITDGEPIIVDAKRITICDSPFNIARCVVHIEVIEGEGG